MKILFLNYEYPPIGGGGGVINQLVAEELAGRHDVTVLTSQGFGTPRYCVENGVKVIRVPISFRKEKYAASFLSMFFYDVTALFRGIPLVLKEQFDIINTHFAVPTGPVGYVLSRLGKCPNIISLMGGDVIDPSKKMSPHRHWILRKIVRGLLKDADRFVGPSTNLLGNVKKYYGEDLEGLQIPFAIKKATEPVLPRSKYGLTDDHVVMVTIARLVPRKQYDQLITMMARLKGEKAHLMILGSGPLLGDLRAQAERLGVQDSVSLPGFVDEAEKNGILQMADMYVSTSAHEGFGLVFCEGLAAGLAIVSYDFGGHTDYLQDGKTGYIVKLNDLDTFTEKCRTLIRDKALRRQMTKNCLEVVKEFFIDRYAEKYEKLFKEVIDEYNQKRKINHR